MNDPSDSLDLDFTKVKPLPTVTEAQTRRLTPTVEVGSSQLKTTGFFVTMPRDDTIPPITSRKPQILIIDDEAAVREVLSIYLQVDGYQTRSAGTRSEILRELNRPPLPDLILCDVDMPDINGFDLLNKFHQSNALKNVPVVMLTGRSERKDILMGLSLGAVGYITKPAKLGVVEEAVRKLLR